MSPKERIAITCDEGTFEEFDAAMHPKNPMGYPDYDKVIEKAQKRHRSPRELLQDVVR